MSENFGYDEAKQFDSEGKYDSYKQNGGPFDRGGADYWYHREPEPHWWPEGTGHGTKKTQKEMTEEEIEAYYAGYIIREEEGKDDRKDYF